MVLRLKELRLQRNLTQAEVAKAIGVATPNYSRYENGVNEPPLSIICKLADFFDTSVDYILYRVKEVIPISPDIFDTLSNIEDLNASFDADYKVLKEKLAKVDDMINETSSVLNELREAQKAQDKITKHLDLLKINKKNE